MYILITYFMDMFELVHTTRTTNKRSSKKKMMGDDDVNEESRILRRGTIYVLIVY